MQTAGGGNVGRVIFHLLTFGYTVAGHREPGTDNHIHTMIILQLVQA